MNLLSDMFVSSPHGRVALTTNQMMRMVCYAAVPGFAAQIYFFGWGALFQLILCIVTALLSEALILSLREKPVRQTLADGSAILTAVLLALSIPPFAPWWIAVIGTAFAIIVVKQLYGGMGFNLFNPAMAAYVMLLISFPVPMTSWLPPAGLMVENLNIIDALHAVFTGFSQDGYSINQLRMAVDGHTMATPLDNFKLELAQQKITSEIITAPIYGEFGGTGWLGVNLGFLLGGLYLVWQGVIRWHIPVAVITSLFIANSLFYMFAPDTSLSPIMHSLTGGTMFCAFFIATDPVSASTTNKGRLYYGALIGVLICLIRQWGGYPDGVAFAVLLTNMCVPLIDYYTQPKVYGHPAKNKAGVR